MPLNPDSRRRPSLRSVRRRDPVSGCYEAVEKPPSAS